MTKPIVFDNPVTNGSVSMDHCWKKDIENIGSDQIARLYERIVKKEIVPSQAQYRSFWLGLFWYYPHLFANWVMNDVQPSDFSKCGEFHQEVYTLLTDMSIKRLAMAAPRGHAKSWTVNGVLLAWLIGFGLVKEVIIVSSNATLAAKMLGRVKKILTDSTKYKQVFGELADISGRKGSTWKENEIITKNGVRVTAYGHGGKIRGDRADLILLDDLEDDELVKKKERRDKLEEWMNGTVLPVLKPEGRMLYIGTLLHHDAVLNRVLHPRKYKSWTKKIYRAYKRDGSALWPEHWSKAKLEERRKELIASGHAGKWASEYMQNPTMGESAVFKQKWIRHWGPYTMQDMRARNALYITTTVDPAVSQKSSADNGVVLTCGWDSDDNLYRLREDAGHFTPDELIELMIEHYEEFDSHAIGVEAVAYQQALIHHFERIQAERKVWVPIEPLHVRTDKMMRAQALVPWYKLGKVYHNPDGDMDYEEEMLQFPKSARDDRVDAMSLQMMLKGELKNDGVAAPKLNRYGMIVDRNVQRKKRLRNLRRNHL